MKKTTIAAVTLIAVGVLSVWKPGIGTGVDRRSAITAPDVATQKIVAPITEVLNGHSKQANTLAVFYFEASETIRREGKAGGRIVKTKSHLRIFCKRAATLRFQEVFKKVPGLAEAVHGGNGALSKILGLKSGPLDHGKAADALHAVAWACQEAT